MSKEHKCNCGCEHEHHNEHKHETCNCNSNTCASKEQEYLELAQRIKAEFENYKRRNAEITSISFNNGVVSTITKLLPAIDSFNQAKANIKDEDTLVGLNLILNNILTAFSELGVEKIDAVGKEFDPNLHNAILTGKDETKPEGIVLEEYQQGFKLRDRVIRHSVVKINKYWFFLMFSNKNIKFKYIN